MGRARTPVRDLLNWVADRFLRHLPITYVLTVRSLTPDGRLVTRGLFAGDDGDCYDRGARFAAQLIWMSWTVHRRRSSCTSTRRNTSRPG